MNDKTAKLILSEDRYPGGANCPTEHCEYECPCGKGHIIYENVPGFDDRYAWIDCPDCNRKYDIVLGMGSNWELIKK